jgi:hypothetical protein
VTVNLQGHVFNAAGEAINGAVVDIFPVGTAADESTSSDSATASATSDSTGLWTSSGIAEGLYDVRIKSGSDVRWLRYEDRIQVDTIETATLKIRNPADTYEYNIVPAAIVADRTLTLPLITTTDTLPAIGFAQTWSATQSYSANADIAFTGTTGTNDIVLTNALADALSVTDGSADILVIDTSTAGNVMTFTSAVTVGVNDTGHNVKLFGASAGAYMEWLQSADQLRIMGASADATTSTGKLLLATSLTDINANDVIGKIDFQAPHEAGGGDSTAILASIQAIAQGTFSSSVNATDLIFYTGHSEAATEKFRMTSEGQIGIGGANYGNDGQVLTSNAGAAVAWEDASGGQTTYDAVVDAAGGGDYTTIQAAEDALDGSSHYTVYVKQGAYSTVAIGQAGGCTWVFEGKCTFSGVINVASGANISLVFGPGCTFADVVSLTATDSSIHFGAGCNLDGQLNMDGAGGSVICENGCDLDDLTIAAANCTFNGGGWDTVIDGTTANHAITITSGGEKALVSNVAVQTTAGGGSAYDGVSCGGGSSVVTRVRVVASDDVGIHVLHPANQARVYDCEIKTTDDAGIKTEKAGVIIQGNWMEGIGGIGIEMIGDNGIVMGNVVGPSITGDSIDLASGSDNNVVVANRIEGALDDNGTGNTVASNDSTAF